MTVTPVNVGALVCDPVLDVLSGSVAWPAYDYATDLIDDSVYTLVDWGVETDLYNALQEEIDP